MTFALLLWSVLLAHPAPATPAARKVELRVTEKGFEPAEIKVKKGEALELVVTRTTDETCAKKLVIKETGEKRDLPLNKPVTIALKTEKSGAIHYACGMDMLSGVVLVE